MSTISSFDVRIEDSGESYRCASDESLLHGMARMGKRGIPVGCQGGGCGVCRVQVVTGEVSTRAMSRDHVSEADELARCLLACRVFPHSNVAVRIVGKMKKNVCRPADGLSTSNSEECK
jgi:ferredoxin